MSDSKLDQTLPLGKIHTHIVQPKIKYERETLDGHLITTQTVEFDKLS